MDNSEKYWDVASVIPYKKRFICFAMKMIVRKGFGRSKPLPYNKRFICFAVGKVVEIGIYFQWRNIGSLTALVTGYL